jgi:hypothetical protein
LQSISKDEDRVRKEIQRLGDLHAQFKDQITGNDGLTQLKRLPPSNAWDLIKYEVAIQHESSDFKSIQEDVGHIATHKIASALEESLIQSLMPMVRVSIGFGTAIA